MPWLATVLKRAAVFWLAAFAIVAWRKDRVCTAIDIPGESCALGVQAWSFFSNHNIWGMALLILMIFLIVFGPFLLWSYADKLDSEETERNAL